MCGAAGGVWAAASPPSPGSCSCAAGAKEGRGANSGRGNLADPAQPCAWQGGRLPLPAGPRRRSGCCSTGSGCQEQELELSQPTRARRPPLRGVGPIPAGVVPAQVTGRAGSRPGAGQRGPRAGHSAGRHKGHCVPREGSAAAAAAGGGEGGATLHRELGRWALPQRPRRPRRTQVAGPAGETYLRLLRPAARDCLPSPGSPHAHARPLLRECSKRSGSPGVGRAGGGGGGGGGSGGRSWGGRSWALGSTAALSCTQAGTRGQRAASQ